MLAASPVFNLFSRTLSKCSFQSTISAWAYTCSSCNQSHLKVWENRNNNDVVLEKNFSIKNEEWDSSEAGFKQSVLPQNRNFNSYQEEILWKDRLVVSRESLKWGKEATGDLRDLICLTECKGLGKNFKVSQEYKRRSYHTLQCHRAKYKSNAGIRLLMGSSKLDLSSLCHGTFDNIPSRSLHAKVNMYENECINSKYRLLGPMDLHGKSGQRYKSFGSRFKRLFLKLLKDKDLPVKEKALKEIEMKTAQKEAVMGNLQKKLKSETVSTSEMLSPKRDLGDLIYGCMSSKHLLDLIVPWIENDCISLNDIVKVSEHLQNLQYSEIMELYPDLPYGSVAIMYKSLQLLGVERKVFNEIHEHEAFQSIVKYLKDDVDSLTNSQYVTCFSCMTHLGISQCHPLMVKFYTRLTSSDSKNYSVLDIVHLHNVAKCHKHTNLVLAAYVVPKLKECLQKLKFDSVDIDTFRALLFIADNIPFGLNKSELVSFYSLLYKVSFDTNCLNNLNCACELLLHLSKFHVQKQFVHFSSIYYQLLETHKENIFQTMTDICIQKIKGRSKELSPLKIKKLVMLSRSFLRKTELMVFLQSRVEYFLKHRVNQLSLSEVIWLLSHRAVRIQLQAEDVTKISSKFERLDLSTLSEAWSIEYYYVKCLGIHEIITKKTLEYMNEIIAQEDMYHKALTYSWAMWFYLKEKSFVNDGSGLLPERILHEVYKRGFEGFRTSFASSVLMALPNCLPLKPATLNLLCDIAIKEPVYKRLTQGYIFVILHALCTNAFQTELNNQNCPDVGNQKLHEFVMFHILYKTVLQFHRTVRQDKFVMHVFIRTTRLLLLTSQMDHILQSIVYQKLAESPLQYLDNLLEFCHHPEMAAFLKRNKTHGSDVVNDVVKFALENKEHLTFHNWKRIVHFLMKSGFSAYDNADLQKTLQAVIHDEFSLGPEFCTFVSQCCRIKVDMSKALEIIFSLEYLNKTDQLISGKN